MNKRSPRLGHSRVGGEILVLFINVPLSAIWCNLGNLLFPWYEVWTIRRVRLRHLSVRGSLIWREILFIDTFYNVALTT